VSDASDKPIIAVTAYGLDHRTQKYVDGVERSNGEPWVANSGSTSLVMLWSSAF